jgi:hypothetical protein
MKNKGAYHYQCLELANMKGERWESVPGFDGASIPRRQQRGTFIVLL